MVAKLTTNPELQTKGVGGGGGVEEEVLRKTASDVDQYRPQPR